MEPNSSFQSLISQEVRVHWLRYLPPECLGNARVCNDWHGCVESVCRERFKNEFGNQLPLSDETSQFVRYFQARTARVLCPRWSQEQRDHAKPFWIKGTKAKCLPLLCQCLVLAPQFDPVETLNAANGFSEDDIVFLTWLTQQRDDLSHCASLKSSLIKDHHECLKFLLSLEGGGDLLPTWIPSNIALKEQEKEDFQALQAKPRDPIIKLIEKKPYSALIARAIHEGAAIDVQDMKGRIPLHVAVTEGHLNVVALLLISGSPIDVKDAEGSTPMDLAEASGDSRLINLLNGTRRTDRGSSSAPRNGQQRTRRTRPLREPCTTDMEPLPFTQHQ